MSLEEGRDGVEAGIVCDESEYVGLNGRPSVRISCLSQSRV